MNTHRPSIKARMLGFLLPALVGAFAIPALAFAGTVDLSPRVIDAKGKAREISHHSITLKNNSPAIQNVFVWAVDVDENRGDLSEGDMSGYATTPVAQSPSRWLEIARSIQVLPNEEQSVPLQLQIPAEAKPGDYHVSLRFSYGNTQSDAMACTQCTQDIQMNIEVTEDIREKLQLFSFTAAKNVFTSAEAAFNFSVQNTGNQTLIPTGKIRIFDNNGKEVGTADINADGKQVDPQATQLLGATWMAGGSFGKYKAMLDMSYGQRGTMQDVVYFWVIPWSKMFGFMVALIVAAALLAMLLRGRTMARPSYATAAAYGDDEGDDDPIPDDDYQVPTQRRVEEQLVSRLSRKERVAPTQLNDSLHRANMQVVQGLTEVSIPPRTRTVPPALRIEQKQRVVSEEHQIILR